MSESFYKYSPSISKEIKKNYESALNSELRWQGGVIFSDRNESDLDHVVSMFGLHEEVEWKFPTLFSEVESEEINHMIYIHDAGEILAHDLAHSVPNYSQLKPKVKHREVAAFRLLTRNYIADIELKAYVRNLYNRCEKASPDDCGAQYVKLLDKVQATRFGAEFVFPARKLRTVAERQQQANHIFELHLGPSTNLARNISDEAFSELLEFMDAELLVLRKNGYRANEVDPYRKLMQEMLHSQREALM